MRSDNGIVVLCAVGRADTCVNSVCVGCVFVNGLIKVNYPESLKHRGNNKCKV